MTKEEIEKRFCKFELCTHRNGEGMCCLYNQDNCIFHSLEKENKILRIHQTNAVLNGLEMKVLKDSHRDRANKTQEQLTKAKEIIKTLADDLSMYSGNYQKELLDAEQFLKENGGEK